MYYLYTYREIAKAVEIKYRLINLNKYEKPVIIKQTKMTFPIDIMEANGKGVVCKQCSSCHSCR